MWGIILKEKFEILMEWKKLYQGLRLTRELDEWLLSDEFMEAIT